MKRPSSSTSEMRSLSSVRSGAYCALTSISGIVGTTGHFSGVPAEYEVANRENEESENRVIDEAEAVVEVVPVAPDRPADAGQREAPDCRAGERQHGVAAERHAEDTGRDRAEGA